MQTKPETTKMLFLTGCVLIVTIAMVLLVTSLGFFIDQSVSAWQFPASFIITSAIFYFTGKTWYQHEIVFIKSFFLSIGLILVSLLIAVSFYDITYDGQSYHMEGIYQLKNGWNPFSTTLPDSVNMALYVNHYAKGVELPQSTLYSLTNRIESGKATNLILLFGGFCLTTAYLFSLGKLSTVKSVLISSIAVLNPVILNQLLSTYVDGQLAVLLLCFFVCALWIIREPQTYNLILLAAVILITVNIKFTGLVYVVIFSFALLAWLLFVKKRPLFTKVICTTMFAGIIGTCVIGYNPYIINTIKFEHPFYPLMGKNKVDIMTHNMPDGFESKGELDKFMISLFAHSDNVMTGNQKTIGLKPPFTFNKTDVVGSYQVDTRIAGFGAFFSGIIILAIVLLLAALWQSYKSQITLNPANWLYVIGVIALSVVIIPEAWWARYVPQLWYTPLLVLLMTELNATGKFKIIKVVIYCAFLFDIIFMLFGIRYNLLMTNQINAQMKELKSLKEPLEVEWGSARINRVRFSENQIPYKETDLSKRTGVQSIICSDSKFIVPNNTSNN